MLRAQMKFRPVVQVNVGLDVDIQDVDMPFHKISILTLLILVFIMLYGCGPSKADERRWQEAGWVSGKIVTSKVLTSHTHTVEAVGFSPDGSRVITRQHNGPLRLWDTASGKYIAAFTQYRSHHGGFTPSYVFSSDGKTVVTWPYYTGAGVWDANNGQLLAALNGSCKSGYSSLTQMQFSPDGTRIIAVADYNSALVFDARTGDILFSFSHATRHCGAPLKNRGRINKITYSPDGTRITIWSRDEMVRIWNATNGQLLFAIESKIFSRKHTAVLSHNNTRIVMKIDPLQYSQSPRILSSEIGKIIPMQDAIKANKERGKKEINDKNKDASVAKHKTQGVKRGQPQYKPAASEIQLWNAVNGQYIAVLEQAENAKYTTNSAKFSPDGTRLIINDSRNHEAKLWNAHTGEYLLALKGRFMVGRGLMYEFSPSGNHIVTVDKDNIARIWDVKNGQPLTILKGHRKRILSALFSHDGSRILTSSLDKTNRLWDTQSGVLLATFSIDSNWRGVKYQIAHFSHDGTRVVTIRGNDAIIWDAKTGQRIAVLKGHKSRIYAVKFSPDDTYLVTGSRDDTARIWELTISDNK